MNAAKTAIRWTFFGGLLVGMIIDDAVHSIDTGTMDSTKWLGLIMVAAFLIAAHFRLDAPAQRLVKAVLKEYDLVGVKLDGRKARSPNDENDTATHE